MTKKIAIQGYKGAFHEVAALEYFGEDIQCVECATFKDLCDAVKTGKADHAMMAIENTIAGSILMNYELIRRFKLTIQGEHFLRIQQNLMALKGVKLKDIKKVISHPMALEQCADFLYTLDNVKYIEDIDTALAAKHIADKKLNDTAAIASEKAATLYDLNILVPSIETHKLNYTRFLVLGKNKIEENPNKASIRIELHHETGSLLEVLQILKDNNINMTKLQSVPVVGKPYEYSFFIALIWEKYEDYKTAIEQLQSVVSDFSILGEYRKGNKPDFNLPK